MTFERFLRQRRCTLVVPLGEKHVGKISLCDRRATEVFARLGELEGFNQDRLGVLGIGIAVRSRKMS